MGIQPAAAQPLAVTLQRDWWLVSLRGLIILAFGLFALARPSEFFGAMLAFAALALLGGIIAIIHALRVTDHSGGRTILFLEGIAGVVIGVFVFEYIRKTMFLAYSVALWAIVIGIVLIALSLALGKAIRLAWLGTVVGIIFVVLGVAIVFDPRAVTLGPSYIVGIVAAVVGLGQIVLGLGLRSRPSS